jgi:ABC-type multidrug transport system ATPase subunit/pSer/pThr/pTyr-binding forkhead associated (FHA) protein
MKIVLAEQQSNGVQTPEQAYNQAFIIVGRDVSAECDIAFENKKYPMVSRKHAELRYENGNWILHDLNSSYGTFVDGQRISAPQTLAVGNQIQFGKNGPVLRVVWFEVTSDAPLNLPQRGKVSDTPPQAVPAVTANEILCKQQQKIVPHNIPNFDTSPKTLVNNKSSHSETARLEFVGADEKSPFKLDKQSVWLGRDATCDVQTASSVQMVSRRHAEIRRESGNFIVYDNGSFNGTLINGQRISAPTPLYHEDRIELGIGGPVLRFLAPSHIALKGADLAGQRSLPAVHLADMLPETEKAGAKTMVFKADDLMGNAAKTQKNQPQLVLSVSFHDKKELTVGRAAASDIKLDGLQISNRHARLLHTNSVVAIEDLGSTNGVFVNGERISRRVISTGESAQIGAFVLEIDDAGNVLVFDTRSKTRLDAVGLTRDVKTSAGGVRLLDDVSLSIQPNEFVGFLGASGAGKSTLMNALSGVEPASSGSILINNLDLYRNFDALKQFVGYVPQNDILHDELSVYKTLYYVAKLRLSGDVSNAEINQIIAEVLDVTELAEKRNVAIKQLSGGQRKRVSVAVELITKPSVIFLDEPTSGLDPRAEERIMRLFRQIAESGRTVILTTHAMENVRLFDKVVVLMNGKLVFYGTPDEALKHFQAANFKELYDCLEAPFEQKNDARTADEWKRKFAQTDVYQRSIAKPLKEIGVAQSGGVHKKNRLGTVGAFRQFFTLSRRYAETLLKDKLTLLILFAQAPIIALLTFIVISENQPRDFIYFVLSLVSIWFGTSIAAREIVREKPIYRRERMVNLGIIPYLASKIFVLGIIVILQCVLLFAPLKFLDLTGALKMPGGWFGVPQLWTIVLTAAVGIALGLLISALVKTSQMATSLVPLILIPQILFSGIVGVPESASRVVGLTMPAAWSFDSMKRFSMLETLEPEGATPEGKTRGLGLYKFVATENDRVIVDAKKDLDAFKVSIEEKLRDLETDLRNRQASSLPTLREPPTLAEPKKIPEDLSGYVAFLHPWMNGVLNQLVLMLMFFILTIATLVVLRLKDTH